MRPITLIVLVLAVTALCYYACPDTLKAESAPAAQIIKASGTAKVKTAASGEWVDAKEGMKVKVGDVIKTDAGSTVELAVGVGLSNVINIFPGSQLVISKFDPGVVNLEEGRVFSLIKDLKKGSTFEVRTPTAVSGARGTGWGAHLKDNVTEVQGFEHTAYVAGLNDKGELIGLTDLQEGWKTSLLKGEGPGKLLRLSEEEKSAWKKWKKEALGHLRERNGKQAGAPAVSGSEDMERLEHRANVLDRVERETERSQQNKEDRRQQGETSSNDSDYKTGE